MSSPSHAESLSTNGPLGAAAYALADGTDDQQLEAFLSYTEQLGITLYPAQEEALLEVFAGKHVILNTPTGSGKSLVAAAAHFRAVARKEQSFYTAPIKALVSEKFFELCDSLGPAHVGMMTGDATVNRDAPVICCTAEILSNLALREGGTARVHSVVMDEFHYYSDPDRGMAWQVPLLELPQTTFLLMSATLGSVDFFAEDLRRRTGRDVAIVSAAERPVPLSFLYQEVPLHETIQELLEADRVPAYIVHFSQRAAAERAQSLMSIDVLSKEQKQAIKAELAGFRFDTPYGKDLKRFVHHGIGVHHAGILPKYRRMVERLAQAGHLKLICGTDTLGVGVNVPIRSVLFTQLCKYDGRKTAVLTVRDFQQIAGRAGRKGFDDHGYVYAQAPEHVVENQHLERKAAGDAKKLRKLVRKKPPERGYAHWDQNTFERLSTGSPEPLRSSFGVSHSVLLQLMQRPGDGCLALRGLIESSHEERRRQKQLGRMSVQLLRSLLDLGVLTKGGDGVSGGLAVSEELQEDFSLNQALSLWVVETLAELDEEDPSHALNMVTLVESVLENPTAVLFKQLDKLKKETVDQLKAEGMEYDARMEVLDKLEHPKPLREFVYESYNAFAARHPWAGENIRPKSVVRDMYENALDFRGYIKEYGLLRSEGVLLRYLSDAYRALVQTVPEDAKSDELDDLTDWLYAIIRQVDASLIEEWERLMNPDLSGNGASEAASIPDQDEAEAADITRDVRTFGILVRNAAFRLVRSAAQKNWSAFRAGLANDKDWPEARLEEVFQPYFEEYEELRTDADARASRHVRLGLASENPSKRCEQTLLDPAGNGDWSLKLVVDMDASAREQAPVVALVAVDDDADWFASGNLRGDTT